MKAAMYSMFVADNMLKDSSDIAEARGVNTGVHCVIPTHPQTQFSLISYCCPDYCRSI